MQGKLIKLLEEVAEVEVKESVFGTDMEVNYSEIADHLIANGVTVPQWIPVIEWLPSEDDANDFGEVIAMSGREVRSAVFDPYTKTFFRHCFPLVGVTHWMPMPKPLEKEV